MAFLKKYKGYFILAAIMTAALAAAFFFASPKNEPVASESSAQSESPAVSVTEAESSASSAESIMEPSEVSAQSSDLTPQSYEKTSEVSERSEESSRLTVSVTENASQPVSAPESSKVKEEHIPEVSEVSRITEEHKPESSAPVASVQESSRQAHSKPEEIVSRDSESSTTKSEPSAPTESSRSAEAQSFICTLFISCETAVKNPSLDPKKLAVLPEDGIILAETGVSFSEGESVFDVLQRSCRERGIVLSAPKTPFYGGAYIQGINDLCERDCGAVSGWMYSVNGEFPSVGCSSYTLEEGDAVRILYTCDLGADIGNVYMGGG